jgi:HTH-type transcriptional regulator, cell division transcriptional repressor
MADSIVYGNDAGHSSVEQHGIVAKTLADHGEISKELLALQIRGSLMEPQFSEGDHVIIDPTIQPVLGDHVAAKVAGFTIFGRYVQRQNKRRKTVIGLAHNEPGSLTLWADRDDINIVGTMVEHRRFRCADATQVEDAPMAEPAERAAGGRVQ